MRKGRIRNRILLIFMVALLILLTIFLPAMYSLTLRALRTSSVSFTEQLLFQVNKSIDIYVDEMINISEYIVKNQSLSDRLRDDTENHVSPDKLLMTQMQGILGYRPDFTSITIFKENGMMISGDQKLKRNINWDYKQMDWYKEAIAAKGQPVLSTSHVEHLFVDHYPWVVSLSRAIYRDDTLLGVLLIDLNYAQIDAICRDLTTGSQGYVYILGRGDELVYHPQQQLIYSGLKAEPAASLLPDGEIFQDKENKRVYISKLSEKSGWRVIGVLRSDQFLLSQPLIVMVFASFFLFFIVVSLVVNRAVRINILEPVNELSGSIADFQQGNFKASAHIHANNEMDEIGESFNAMTVRIASLMEDTKRIEAEKRRSELQTLQAQIRPHFLYNTLESIIWMAEMGAMKDVISMTASLSRLLRAINTDADQLITLQQETELVRHYLIIQKMRYQSKLSYQINIPDPLSHCLLPKICIQPLVENAIYHGLKQQHEGGTIVVDAWSYRDSLILRVADNGVGFQFDKIELDPAGIPKSRNQMEGGIGLANVEERLRLYYGEAFGLSILSLGRTRSLCCHDLLDDILKQAEPLPFQGGTMILLHIPMQKEGEWG